ncbi:MAG: hypothetical protein P8173_10870 [Gammaproteobacteria bacterium]
MVGKRSVSFAAHYRLTARKWRLATIDIGLGLRREYRSITLDSRENSNGNRGACANNYRARFAPKDDGHHHERCQTL